ncbi:MAG TPA: cytochrome c [Candidatus Binataceae bacterium]
MNRPAPISACATIAAFAFAAVAVAISPAHAADLDAAAQNYGTYCVNCHGANGKGQGPEASTLKTRPRDFTNCKRMAADSDDTIFEVIKNGGEAADLSPEMREWGSTLKDSEIHDLIAYVRSFCNK